MFPNRFLFLVHLNFSHAPVNSTAPMGSFRSLTIADAIETVLLFFSRLTIANPFLEACSISIINVLGSIIVFVVNGMRSAEKIKLTTSIAGRCARIALPAAV